MYMLQAREHCFGLLEKAMITNYVQHYKDVPSKLSAQDYIPHCCAIDLEYEVFKGKYKEPNCSN